jgi:hypothetical protein
MQEFLLNIFQSSDLTAYLTRLPYIAIYVPRAIQDAATLQEIWVLTTKSSVITQYFTRLKIR